MRDAGEIGVLSQKGGPCPECNRGDHATDKSAWSDSGLPTTPVHRDGAIEIRHAVERQQSRPCQQSAQRRLALVGTSARGNLGNDRLCHGELAISGDEFGESLIDRAAGGPIELHPGGRVGKDHAAVSGGGRSAGTSPMEFDPRIASASSSVIGSAASLRRARSTTSVLVRRW